MKRVTSLPYIDDAQGNRVPKDSLFASSLLASVLIHLAALIAVSVLMGHRNQLATRNLMYRCWSHRRKKSTPAREDRSVAKKFEPAAPKPQKPPLQLKREQAITEPPPAAKPKEETAKPSESKVSPAPPIERAFPELARDEGGGSAAGPSTFSSGAASGVTPAQEAQAEVALPSPESAAVTGPRVCQRPPARFERIATRSRFKRSAPPIHRWRCALDSKAM
jgi:hypothetical protein